MNCGITVDNSEVINIYNVSESIACLGARIWCQAS